MEEKLKRKKIRKIAIIVLAIALLAGIGLSMTVEKADYGKALGEEVENAQELLGSVETGYDKGQYLPETIALFQKCIEEAKTVFEDKDAVYDDQKAAYEKLKDDEDAFKAAANEKDVKKKKVKKKEKKVEKSEKQIEKEETDSSDNEVKKDPDKKNSDKNSEDKNPKKSTETKTEDEYITVTIQIRCDNLVGNVEDKSIASYVPSSGVILGKTKYRCKKDSSVYDVLYAVCRNNNIQIESQYTPVYDSQYVEALNHIYEFDGGPESGWMYRVNGNYPDYGCSSYKLKDGDNIVWAYTCNLGKDLGESF